MGRSAPRLETRSGGRFSLPPLHFPPVPGAHDVSAHVGGTPWAHVSHWPGLDDVGVSVKAGGTHAWRTGTVFGPPSHQKLRQQSMHGTEPYGEYVPGAQSGTQAAMLLEAVSTVVSPMAQAVISGVS